MIPFSTSLLCCSKGVCYGAAEMQDCLSQPLTVMPRKATSLSIWKVAFLLQVCLPAHSSCCLSPLLPRVILTTEANVPATPLHLSAIFHMPLAFQLLLSVCSKSSAWVQFLSLLLSQQISKALRCQVVNLSCQMWLQTAQDSMKLTS